MFGRPTLASVDPASPRGPAHAGLAAALNLVLPGAGVILLNAPWTGLGLGLLFALCANLAIVALLILPDDFTRGTAQAIILLTILSYLAAQASLTVTLRQATRRTLAAERRNALRVMQAGLDAGDAGAALHALEPLLEHQPDDLALLSWRARLLDVAGRRADADAAWLEVAKRDPDGVYRAELRARRTSSP